ncbi:MAG: hypothetical protein C3F17_20170 [Bradyrhizobiaceae bacterium]|nr:MAG: hypothetical protein C3F17_20170 [Bradyrhizobiaceae bacterium]
MGRVRRGLPPAPAAAAGGPTVVAADDARTVIAAPAPVAMAVAPAATAAVPLHLLGQVGGIGRRADRGAVHGGGRRDGRTGETDTHGEQRCKDQCTHISSPLQHWTWLETTGRSPQLSARGKLRTSTAFPTSVIVGAVT